MAYNTLLRNEVPPKGLIYALFVMGLFSMTGALLFQYWLLFALIVCSPIAVLTFIYSVQYPQISYFLYFTIAYYFAAIMRYSNLEGLSVILDGLLAYALLTSLLHIVVYKQGKDIRIRNAANTLTICYSVWIIFVFVQLTNPEARFDNLIVSSRGWILSLPLLYILSSILLTTPKKIRYCLILLGTFTLLAFFKVVWQKYRGFDSTEVAWLMSGAWTTHLLHTGIRYFSFFSDAGNFGSNMGLIAIVYGIISFHTKGLILRLFYIGVTIAGIIGLFMSGTRGAIIVPFGGLLLYCLLSKNLKVMVTSVIAGSALFAVLAFTDIGNGNPFIRRMRTAFTPTEDASFNVRKENQIRIARQLEDKPIGIGIGNRMIDTENLNVQQDNIIPPDSFYVDLWIQTGIVGLILYISILTIVLLRCCYLIMFRIKNQELKHILAAMLCGIFGLWLNGYIGNGMGFQPGSTIAAAFIAFVLNGPEIDKILLSKKTDNLEIKTI